MKTQPRSDELDCLINWLRLKPADGEYKYHSEWGCLLANYYCEQLGKSVVVSAVHYWVEGEERTLPQHFNWIAHGPGSGPREWDRRTYGEALERALLVRERQRMTVTT